MKEKDFTKIERIGLHGVILYGITQRFYDDEFSKKENLYKYKISRIKVYLGENNNILGIQTIFRNSKREEVAGVEGRDQTAKVIDTKILEIEQYDFLSKFKIFVGNDYITKLVFITNKGKELSVGTEEGEEKIVDSLNNNTNIILSFFGGYCQNHLQAIGCRYMNISDYLAPINKHVELKKKISNESFKQKILNDYKNLSEIDKAIFKTCCLPENAFLEVIKFCID